jgi:O-antigen/teichoic acid export membrane protein
LVTNRARLINIGLRGATLATRFLFIFFLAKYLDPASVGYYGIFTVTVGYAMYFVGLDFYTYVSREIVKTPANQRGQLLKAQLTLSGLLYLSFLPVGVWLLMQSGWPGYLLYWFVPILMLEHFNQEVSRLLIALSEQLTSSVILFIRQGSWAIAIIALMYLDSSTRNLNFVMALWAVAGIAAAGTGIWKLKQLKTEGWQLPINWAWIKKGIAVSAAFLIATLALRGVQTFDRYWLEALGGIEMVGAYVLLIGIAGTMLTFLDAAVFAFAYPNLIRLHHENNLQEAQKQVKVLLWQTIALSGVFAVISWIALPYLLAWIGNALYQESAHWYPWLLAAMTLNALSMVPHYALYARGQDKSIIHSHMAALVVFVGTTALLSPTQNTQAVLIGLNAAFASILLWKSIAYLLLLQQHRQTKSTPAHA